MIVRRTQLSRHHTKAGFTIVETLVAVAVLMIAIAGPLVVATRGLNSALASKDQMIASYLAQDTLEMIKNTRDGNVFGHPDAVETYWLVAPLNTSFSSCNADTSGNSCDFGGIDNDLVVCTTQIGSTGVYSCPIYYNANTGYTHSSASPAYQTVFYRKFYLQDKSTNNGKSEKLVHVIVDWYEGTVPYQVHVTSQLIATSR